MSGKIISVERDVLEASLSHQVSSIREFARDKLRAALAEPANKCGRCEAATVESCNDRGCHFFESGNGEPAAQPQGEPIYQVRAYGEGWHDVNKVRYEYCADLPGYKYRIVYAEQSAPVAVVLPERLAQILKFLEGSENLDGYWFGEPGPTGSLLWWRAELRKALTETNLFAKQQ